MPDIPKDIRVRLRIKYNGFIHPALGMKWDEAGQEGVRVFVDQFPKGYRAEHDSDELHFAVGPGVIVPDESGVDGWVMPEPFDLDETAFWQRSD